MPATFQAESLFGGGGISKTVNPPQGTAKETVASPGNPGKWTGSSVLPGLAVTTGMPVPMLIGMGVLAWYLFRKY